MKVEVTVELDINLTKANISDIKKILGELLDAKNIEALESFRIKDIKLGK